MPDTIDLKKTLNAYRAPRGGFRTLEVPEMSYLKIDGHGDPNTAPAWVEALEALYPVAYGLKFVSKRELGRDYVVPPLEGLWWAEKMEDFTLSRDKSQWNWTAMIMVPDWIGADLVARAIQEVAAKKPLRSLDEIRLEELAEGLCIQTLHIGSFDAEGPVLERMHREAIPELGLRPCGRHHEIYLSDFRRTVPERLRTILRQPVRPVAGMEETAQGQPA